MKIILELGDPHPHFKKIIGVVYHQPEGFSFWFDLSHRKTALLRGVIVDECHVGILQDMYTSPPTPTS